MQKNGLASSQVDACRQSLHMLKRMPALRNSPRRGRTAPVRFRIAAVARTRTQFGEDVHGRGLSGIGHDLMMLFFGHGALQKAVEEGWMFEILPVSVLSHCGNHTHGRERAEQRRLQNVRLLVGIDAEIVQGVVAALQHAVRLLHHCVNPFVQNGAQVRWALPVPILLRRLDGIAGQLSVLVRGQLVC